MECEHFLNKIIIIDLLWQNIELFQFDRRLMQLKESYLICLRKWFYVFELTHST
jgi:hypothetical protein